jgi:hypothetical protein
MAMAKSSFLLVVIENFAFSEKKIKHTRYRCQYAARPSAERLQKSL